MLTGNAVFAAPFQAPPIEDLPESLLPKPTSNGVSMKPPQPEQDDGDCQIIAVRPERRLYSAVFAAAFDDLIRGNVSKRMDAIDWFKGERKDEPVTYLQCLELFSFSASRVAFIKACIEDPSVIYKARGNKKFRSTGNRSR